MKMCLLSQLRVFVNNVKNVKEKIILWIRRYWIKDNQKSLGELILDYGGFSIIQDMYLKKLRKLC